MKKNTFTETLTHSEILVYAIRSALKDYREFQDKLSRARAVDACLAESLEKTDYTRQKLEALFDLYRLETGNEHPDRVETEEADPT